MRLLFACEFYAPSVGGVQEVMKQLAERMVQFGHHVTVATTRLAEREFSSLNGVEIVGFDIAGNAVRGMVGEVDRYREFVRTFPCDALMVKAAQQWTFDALWPVLDAISCRKVFIPCGFSGLYEPTYTDYFRQLPEILRKWDHHVFYAEQYRDVDFARAHDIDNFSILPNGASEAEFDVPADPDFRRRHGIPEDSFVLLTVGTLTGMKGHREVAHAFARLKLRRGAHVTLLLNGNEPPRPPVRAPDAPPPPAPAVAPVAPPAVPIPVVSAPGLPARILRAYRNEGFAGVRQRTGRFVMRTGDSVIRTGRMVMRAGRWVMRPVRLAARVVRVPVRIAGVLQRQGLSATAAKVHRVVYDRTRDRAFWKRVPERWIPAHTYSVTQWLAAANRAGNGRKLALHTNFPRAELVQAYMAADLFVFASNIEYSPLVLYEAAAAGTPFLTVPVGNSEEIARWTGAGVVCPAARDDRGYTRADPQVFADAIASLAADPARLQELGRKGRQRWEDNFTWAGIARRYEAILAGQAQPCRTMVLKEETQ